MPDPNDLPEQHEIDRLWESLRPISGPPVIDKEARLMLQWLAPDPLARVVLDEFDKMLRHPSPDNVNSMIAFLAKFPKEEVPLGMLPGGTATLNPTSKPEARTLPSVGEAQFRREHRDGVEDERRMALGATRKAVVMPILVSKGWTRGKLAARAGVSKNSVYGYLDGKRKLSAANLLALSEELGLKPEDLPD